MELSELGGRLMLLMTLRRTWLHTRMPEDTGALRHGQLPVLAAIIHAPDCTQAALAEQLRVTPAAVALSAKRLEKAGLIERRVDPDNRRCNRLRATEAGRTAAAVCRENFQAVDEATFQDFSAQEREEIAMLLDRMITNMAGGDNVALYPYCKEGMHR